MTPRRISSLAPSTRLDANDTAVVAVNVRVRNWRRFMVVSLFEYECFVTTEDQGRANDNTGWQLRETTLSPAGEVSREHPGAPDHNPGRASVSRNGRHGDGIDQGSHAYRRHPDPVSHVHRLPWGFITGRLVSIPSITAAGLRPLVVGAAGVAGGRRILVSIDIP